MTARYRVLVDDNSRYMSPEHRSSGREFTQLEDAVTYCKGIVDDFLVSAYRDGMSARELVEIFRAFGEDPFVIGGEGMPTFSAWDYARDRASVICAGR